MNTDWTEIRNQFELPHGTIFLNNGSFGPSPTPVLDAVAEGVRQIDSHPGEQLNAYRTYRDEAKQVLGRFVGMQPEDFVFVTNVTVGMNMIARGLRTLQEGDEILTTNQEYGAVNNIWRFVARKRGADIRTVEIPTPPQDPGEIVDLITTGMTDRTRVIYFSHITTTTGLVTPAAEICRIARDRGILSAVDGAHAPGMIPLNVADLGCDFYTGNCHKWLCAPKGTGFLWASPDAQKLLDPFIVGWGWNEEEETFLGNFENPGTHCIALPAAVAAAVRFQEEIGTEKIEAKDRELTAYGRERMCALPGVRLLTPDRPDMSCALTAFALPPTDSQTLRQSLATAGIIIPNDPREGHTWMRLSTHVYNLKEEIDRLIDVIGPPA